MSKGKLIPDAITVQGVEIRLTQKNKEPFVSLTDIAKQYGEPKIVIQNWMRNKNTVEYLGVWEIMNNAKTFDQTAYEDLKSQSGTNRFTLSPKKWIETVNAKGIISKAGRYGSGTSAHTEIAAEFASFLDPVFKLYVFQELNRLTSADAKQRNLEWNINRIITKANYQIHSEAVKKHLVPPRIKNTKAEGMVFANEADILNVSLFGMTAKQWRLQNPELEGNIRDHATTEQLLVLSNLQSLNAKLMEWGSDEEQRLDILNKTAIEHMQVLTMSSTLKQLPPSEKKGLKKGK